MLNHKITCIKHAMCKDVGPRRAHIGYLRLCGLVTNTWTIWLHYKSPSVSCCVFPAISNELPRPSAQLCPILRRLNFTRKCSGDSIRQHLCLRWISDLLSNVACLSHINITSSRRVVYSVFKLLTSHQSSLSPRFFKGYFPCSASRGDSSV